MSTAKAEPKAGTMQLNMRELSKQSIELCQNEPFLVTARLGNHRKTIPSQDFDNVPCAANWIPPAHGTASSIIFAP